MSLKNRIAFKEHKLLNLKQELNKILRLMLKASYSREMQLNSLAKTMITKNQLVVKEAFSRKTQLIFMVLILQHLVKEFSRYKNLLLRKLKTAKDFQYSMSKE